MNKNYLWHKRPCVVLVRPDFKRGHKRNCAIQLLDTGEKLVVPFRALRKLEKYNLSIIRIKHHKIKPGDVIKAVLAEKQQLYTDVARDMEKHLFRKE